MSGRSRVVFIDVLFVLLMIFVLLPHEVSPQEDDKSPGDIIVWVWWPDGWHTDVDLWVRSPGDRGVGYSRLTGKHFNLLRDDLGRSNDITPRNFETVYSRGAPDGEYVVNLHLYRQSEDILPVPVEVEVSYKRLGARAVVMLRREVNLTHVGQELTAVRWTLTGNAFLDIHDTPVRIRGK